MTVFGYHPISSKSSKPCFDQDWRVSLAMCRYLWPDLEVPDAIDDADWVAEHLDTKYQLSDLEHGALLPLGFQWDEANLYGPDDLVPDQQALAFSPGDHALYCEVRDSSLSRQVLREG
jgi:hypothetical protein